MNPDDAGMSQRERRRQQYQKNKPKVRIEGQDLKKWIVPVALLLLVGGVVAIMVISDSDENALGCSGHYHYTLDVFLDGEKLALNAPGDNKFVDSVGHDLHMHSTDPNTGTGLNLIHNHFRGGANQGLHPENCFSYGDAFDALSMSVSDQELVLRAVHGDRAGTYEVGEGKTLRVFGKGWEDSEWQALDLATLDDNVPPVSSQLAIVYGDAGEDAMALLESSATTFPVQSYPPDGNPNDPPHYTSFDEMQEK